MAQSTTHQDDTPIEHMQTVVHLLENPALARIYTYILDTERATVNDLITNLGIAQGTAYDYVRNLEAAEVLTKTHDERPHEYEAEPISLTLTTNGDARTVTPALIDAVAHRTENKDIDLYIDRHGVDGLAAALDYAREFVNGTVNHRITARELDLSALEAEIILQALEAIVRTHCDDE